MFLPPRPPTVFCADVARPFCQYAGWTKPLARNRGGGVYPSSSAFWRRREENETDRLDESQLNVLPKSRSSDLAFLLT